MNLLDELKSHSLFQQATQEDTFAKFLQKKGLCAYTGFDPTADSLHVGHLIPIMGLARLKKHGAKVIALIGGGTALIGDPSGKTEMRKMLSSEQIDQNSQKISAQIQSILSQVPSEFGQSVILDNRQWLTNLNYIDFLREFGSRFSVNRMLSFEVYKARMEHGLSFLEFNYQVLQAYDFLELYRHHDCQLQLGGDDQWANILSGVDLIRRIEQQEVYGMTYPLLTLSSGLKMGKTEQGAIWLDSTKTTPYEFYQYWINVEDSDVLKLLGIFTFLPLEELHQFAKLEGADLRQAKAKLAFEVTTIVHGKQAAEDAQKTSQALFSGQGDSENTPSVLIDSSQIYQEFSLLEALVFCKLCQSKSEARRLIAQGGAYINGNKQTEDVGVGQQLKADGELLLRAGKKRYCKLVFESH